MRERWLQRVANELIAGFQLSKGAAFKKKEDTYKMAEANKRLLTIDGKRERVCQEVIS